MDFRPGKLSQVQADILKCVLHRASCSVDEISKLMPYKPHVVRRCLEKLRDTKTLRKSIFCNFYKLGYVSYNIHFTPRADRHSLVPELINFLVKHPSVSWCAQRTGDYDYEISVLSRDLRGVTDLLDDIADTFGDIIEKKQFAAELAHNYFGYKYISDLPVTIPVVQLEESLIRFEIDELDATLMRVLSVYGDVSLLEVARKLKQPATKLTYRKQRLIERGLLLKDTYVLDRCAVVSVPLSVFITVSNHDADFRHNFMKFLAEHPNCWCCHRCLGAWDYRVVLHGDSVKQVMSAVDDMKRIFGGKMLSTWTSTLLQEFKYDHFPFDLKTLDLNDSASEARVV
jgi:DNA-binding Lrp family transcriptional regulator